MKEKAEKIKKLPERYRITICPIGFEVMEDPVVVNGCNYNRKHIIEYGRRNGMKCPNGKAFKI